MDNGDMGTILVGCIRIEMIPLKIAIDHALLHDNLNRDDSSWLPV